ncbi:MAG: hypothetical protein Q4G58_17880 [bacterium]|nr:hypothetical protein [bacterium]
MAKDNRELATLWKKRIKAYAGSNLNIREWCRQNGVTASQYHYWVKKLNSKDSANKSDEVQLVEVSLEPEKKKLPNNEPIILHFHDFEIEIPKNFDKEAIAEVLLAIVSVC